MTGVSGIWITLNAQLYTCRSDGRLHLYGAETGVWRIDQNAEYFQGWVLYVDWTSATPKRFATVLYSDRDNNGFFDRIEYDLDGDMQMETVINFKELGIDDTCEVIDISKFTYNDYVALCKRMSWRASGKRQDQAVQVARQYGIEPLWICQMDASLHYSRKV